VAKATLASRPSERLSEVAQATLASGGF